MGISGLCHIFDSIDLTFKEIQAAFRKLAIIYHPDKQLNSAQAKQEAAGRFQRISQAYSVLRDGKCERASELAQFYERITNLLFRSITLSLRLDGWQ